MSDVNSLDQVHNLINRSTVLIKLSLSKVAFILKVRKLKMFSDLPLPYSQQNQAVSSYGRWPLDSAFEGTSRFNGEEKSMEIEKREATPFDSSEHPGEIIPLDLHLRGNNICLSVPDCSS